MPQFVEFPTLIKKPLIPPTRRLWFEVHLLVSQCLRLYPKTKYLYENFYVDRALAREVITKKIWVHNNHKFSIAHFSRNFQCLVL